MTLLRIIDATGHNDSKVSVCVNKFWSAEEMLVDQAKDGQINTHEDRTSL